MIPRSLLFAPADSDRKMEKARGCGADLVILDQDPTTIDPATLPSVHVTATIVGGQLVYTSPSFTAAK